MFFKRIFHRPEKFATLSKAFETFPLAIKHLKIAIMAFLSFISIEKLKIHQTSASQSPMNIANKSLTHLVNVLFVLLSPLQNSSIAEFAEPNIAGTAIAQCIDSHQGARRLDGIAFGLQGELINWKHCVRMLFCCYGAVPLREISRENSQKEKLL